MIGQHLRMLVPENVRDVHDKHHEGYFKKPSNRPMGLNMDLRAVRKDGTEFPVLISLNHIKLDDNMFATALITDITERVKVKEKLEELNEDLENEVELRTAKLRESEKLYSIMARNFPNGTISVLDKELNYVFVEGQGLYSIGITSDKLIGTGFIDRLPSTIQEEVRERIAGVFRGKNTHFEVNKGHETYLLNAVGLSDDDGIVDRILLVEQNITQQKLAEQQVLEALAQERELNEFKSRFVSMASHEFRTPLSTVLSSANLLEKYQDEEHADKRAKHIQRIVNSVQNLTSILNDFLSLSKLEEGKVQTSPTEFDLYEWAQDIADEMQLMSKKDQQIIYEHEGERQSPHVDQNILRNITVNLLSNAIKYSGEGDRIWFRTEFINNHMEIQVRDEGIGIPKEDQEHMFDRFFRAHNATNIQGTGLGLHIVNKYAELLHGTVSFESKEGEGTTFTVRIPKTIKA